MKLDNPSSSPKGNRELFISKFRSLDLHVDGQKIAFNRSKVLVEGPMIDKLKQHPDYGIDFYAASDHEQEVRFNTVKADETIKEIVEINSVLQEQNNSQASEIANLKKEIARLKKG